METTDTRPITRNVNLPGPALLDVFARRALDVIASALGLLFLAPVFAIIAFAIKRDTPGPVFYRGPRAGRGGRPFGILKFRTMFERPESYQGPRVTASGDDRITPLGHWLRDTKLNELPQLWNVLTGEMALVGPRPEDPEIIEQWPEDLREELLAVRPGVTSPATVMFRGEEQLLQTDDLMLDYLSTVLPNKLRIDSLYLRRRSLLTDLDVIFMTLALLLPRIRDSRVPETLLLWGPLSRFCQRYLNWFALDFIVAFAAILSAEILFRAQAPLYVGWAGALRVAFSVSLLFSLLNSFLGLNRIQWRRARSSDAALLALSSIVTTWMIILADFLFRRLAGFHLNPLPNSLIAVAGLFAFFGFTALRYRERLITGLAGRWLAARGGKSIVGERVLLVGAGNNSQFAIWLLTRPELIHAFTIIGMVDDDPRTQGLVIEGYPILGATNDIPRIVCEHNVGVIIYTISHIDYAGRSRILKQCARTGVRTVILPDMMVEISTRLHDAHLELDAVQA